MNVASTVNVLKLASDVLLFLPGHDLTSFVEEIGIIERVVSLVGHERIECLLADRDFGNLNFSSGCK